MWATVDRIKPAGKFPERLRFFVNGTSKFSGARQVVGETGKEVLLRRTLAYGTKYGIGVFCLTDAGEQQIGCVPDKDRMVLDAVGIMPFAKLPSQN